VTSTLCLWRPARLCRRSSVRPAATLRRDVPTRHGGEEFPRYVRHLQLPQASASRPGAQGSDDYGVIGAEGFVIGRIFRATTSPVDRMWMLAYGYDQDRTNTSGRARPLCRHSPRVDQPIGRSQPALRSFGLGMRSSCDRATTSSGSFTPQTRSRPRRPPSRNLRSARISGAGSWCANRTRRVLMNRPVVSAFGQTGHRADIAERPSLTRPGR
jgi:hypothetical protein